NSLQDPSYICVARLTPPATAPLNNKDGKRRIAPLACASIMPGRTATMSVDSFKELMDRVKAGDQKAAFEVALHYGPLIRQLAHRLIDKMRLGRFYDSVD